MPEQPKAAPPRLSAPEFLAAIEESGILLDAEWRELKERLSRRAKLDNPLALAHELISDGTLTEFQARRLLKGKKNLTFGRFTLLEHIGQGGRGRVFKARHRLMDRVVALKVLLPETILNNETAVARFFREMKIVALLENPHVVRAIDADVYEGCPYIVMEYLEGDDLERVVARRGPLPPPEVIDYMAQAARGLAHAHAKGVIHRDVKPTNMFLVKTGTVKLLDLGCGALVGMAGQTGNVFDTDEGIVVGTTDFMSPEQVRDKAIDARTDLFSLGCTMYRLLTATYAFPGITSEDRLIKRIRQSHVPITEVRPGLSDRLVTVIDRLLALSPDDRYSSATEVVEALEALLPSPVPARSPVALTPEPKTPSASSPPVPDEPEPGIDWSLIESALRPASRVTREAPRLVERSEAKPRSTRDLSDQPKIVEETGKETARDVHAQYRKELIQMNRAMAELRASESKDEGPSPLQRRLERIGERIGDILAEPSAIRSLVWMLVILLLVSLFFYLAGS